MSGNNEPSNDPQAAIDKVVAEVERADSVGPTYLPLQELKPWLLQLGTDGPFTIEAVTMTRDWFMGCLTDGKLCDDLAKKDRPRIGDDITDDMRVRYAQKLIESFMEERDSLTCLQHITSRRGGSAVVAFVYLSYLEVDSAPSTIDRLLGAWSTAADFWAEAKHIDTELPPTYDEILKMWDDES